jgi:hypothetical protein
MSAPLVMPDLCSRKHPLHFTTALNMLSRDGIAPHDVNLLAVGKYKNYRGEVIEQSPAPGAVIDRGTKITLGVGFPSAVDMLPYQFFYGLTGSSARSDEWEDRARKLMAPFDAAVIRHSAEARETLLTYSLGVLDSSHISRFLKLFDFDASISGDDLEESLYWFALMPAFHEWAGNPAFVEHILTHVTGYRCKIVENTPVKYPIPEALQMRLGNVGSGLGSDAVIGDSFEECDTGFEVIVEGVKPGDVAGLLLGGTVRGKVESILSSCMPSIMKFNLRVIGARDRSALGDERAGMRLGYSSYLLPAPMCAPARRADSAQRIKHLT